ncbi:MAG: ATP-binding cassette domain-containing protein, partial [Luminiphilus sp.]|nr:ATP-binding cassette domain-containing protein [Luminiphilus sp.]
MSNQLIIRGCLERARFTLDLDLCIDLNEPLGIMGATGAGKTTLLRIITGLEPDFTGSVAFCGEVWRDGMMDRVPTHQRGLGVVFQDSRLLPRRTVENNLNFAIQRAPAVDSRLDYVTLVEALDLRHLLRESVDSLSGGERQRVGLARALLARPRLLLLDEPLSANDSAHRQQVIAHLGDWMSAEGTPFIYVSHAAAELAQLTRQVLILDQGAVRALGKTDTLLEAGNVVPGTEPPAFAAVVVATDNDSRTATLEFTDVDDAGVALNWGERVVVCRDVS